MEAEPNSSKTYTKCGSIVEADGRRGNNSHMTFSNSVLHKCAGFMVEGVDWRCSCQNVSQVHINPILRRRKAGDSHS